MNPEGSETEKGKRDRSQRSWLVAPDLAVLGAGESRMLAVSGAFTLSAALSAYRIFWGKWDDIDQEKSIAPRLGCLFY